MHRSSFLGAALPCLCLFACSGLGDSSSSSPGRTGDLGHGTFAYQCVDVQQDPACGGSAAPSSFPAEVAVHGRFKLVYSANGAASDVGNPNIEPVSKEFLSVITDQLQALRPGTANVVVRTTTDGRVIDFTPIHISPVSAIQIVAVGGVVAGAGGDAGARADGGATGGNGAALPPGASTQLLVQAFDPIAKPLAGVVGVTWTSSDPTIASVASASATGATPLATVTAVKAGLATITASTEDKVTAQVTITVAP